MKKTLLPSYMGVVWKCYEELSREDILALDPNLATASVEYCHEAMLPFLALEVDADISGLNVERARKSILMARKSLKYAGTLKALKENIEAISDNTAIKEWFEYDGEPYHFSVDINSSEIGIDEEFISKMERTIQKHKNVRSKLDKMRVFLQNRGKVFVASTVISGENIKIMPYRIKNIVAQTKSYLAAGLYTIETIKIKPRSL